MRQKFNQIETRRLKGQPFKFGQHTLMFIHIPKCGGTSLHQTVKSIFGDRYEHGRKFLALSRVPVKADECKILSGGGGHTRFGKDPLSRDPERQFVYITVLRNPADRFLSFYKHIQDHKYHRIRKEYPEVSEMTPLEFAKFLHDANDPEAGNRQVLMTTGREDISGEDAIAHLEQHYSIVGLLERIDLFLEQLGEMFPNYIVKQHSLNKSKTTTRPTDRQEFEKYIQQVNAEDYKLFNHFAKGML